jgi:hypothetical protein
MIPTATPEGLVSTRKQLFGVIGHNGKSCPRVVIPSQRTNLVGWMVGGARGAPVRPRAPRGNWKSALGAVVLSLNAMWHTE